MADDFSGDYLNKGDEFELDFKKYPDGFIIGLNWEPNAAGGSSAFKYDADLVLAVLDGNGKFLTKPNKPSWLVFFKNLSAPNGAVTLDKDNRTGEDASDQGDDGDENAHIKVGLLPDEAQKISILALIYEGKERQQDWGKLKARLTIRDTDGSIIAAFNLASKHEGHTSIEAGALLRVSGNQWKFLAVDVGHNRELGEFVNLWK